MSEMSEVSNGEQSMRQSQETVLGETIARYDGRPVHELGWINEKDIKAISSKATTEAEKAVVRPFFKKILLATPSWADAHSLVRGLPDLTYAPQDRPVVDDEARKATERAHAVEAEIAEGTAPWLAHVRHNEKGLQNPYVVGFYQDDEGKIKSLYGERFFRSQRQKVESDSILSRGRSEAKEVNLLAGKFQRAEGASVQKSAYWDLLPTELKAKFEAGEILVTDGGDLYDLSEAEINRLSQLPDPKALSEHLQQVTQAASPEAYRILYYSEYRSNDTGRTGVLVKTEDGEVKPVTVEINGKEYVVEVKGCGTKEGGFGEMHYRTGRDIITGGAEAEQARNEFDRLSDNIGTDKPLPAGSITFDNNGYAQGYIVRLTPSTVRASYSGNEVYPEIDKPENVERVLSMYADVLTEQIFAPTPKILDRSYQTENLLLWGDGRFTFTDFSDHVAFNDKNYPHDENQGGGYMTPKQMLYYFVERMYEVPGYTQDRDQQIFYRKLERAFSNQNRNLSLEATDTPDVVTQKIWEQGGMAYQVFKARSEGGYIAEGALHEFDEQFKLKHSTINEDLSLTSESEFTTKFREGLVNMREALRIVGSRVTTTEDREVIQKAVDQVEQGDLAANYEVMNGAWKCLMKVIQYDNPGDKKISEAFSYAGDLLRTVSPIRDYLLHETDVLDFAKVGCPDTERDKVQTAEEELKERVGEFTETVRDPHKLFKLLTDPDQARKLVTFSFYKGAV